MYFQFYNIAFKISFISIIMITKLIIFGSNGMLGSYMTKYFKNIISNPPISVISVIPVTRKEFDVENLSTLESYLEALECNEETCVINCIGMIPQRLKNNITEYYMVNTVFPLHLSKICKRFNSHLICPTTDCVFNGKTGDYVETDEHNESDTYGMSKSLGEPIDATVIRASIIGEEENQCSFLEFVKNSKEMNGWDNHVWNGITCYQYCKIVHQIIAEQLFWKGVRHIYSEKKTKYELACIIRDVYKLDSVIHKTNTPININKSLSSIYSPLFDIPSLEQQIQEQKDIKLK